MSKVMQLKKRVQSVMGPYKRAVEVGGNDEGTFLKEMILAETCVGDERRMVSRIEKCSR